MHHVELLMDPVSEVAVREEWRVLDEAGLPSQARHRGASNAPHVTLTMTQAWPGAGDLGCALASLSPLPVAVWLGAPLVFGPGPFVLTRLVVASQPLLEVHRGLVDRMPPLASDLLVPGRWTPHVTLGRRLDQEQVSRAVGLLAAAPGYEVLLDRARHWDSQARVEEPLVP